VPATLLFFNSIISKVDLVGWLVSSLSFIQMFLKMFLPPWSWSLFVSSSPFLALCVERSFHVIQSLLEFTRSLNASMSINRTCLYLLNAVRLSMAFALYKRPSPRSLFHFFTTLRTADSIKRVSDIQPQALDVTLLLPFQSF
jgi:hypothetical protein